MSLFVNIDPSTILPELVRDFESYTGVTLKEGDQRRQMLQGFAYALTGVLQSMESTGRQNLLQYSIGSHLDALGELVGVSRLSAQVSLTTLQFTLSASQSQAVTIPQGTRATPDGVLFYATTQPLTVPAGELTGSVEAAAVQPGEAYDGFLPGQINTLVDGVPFVATVVNTTTSLGGTDQEEDDSLRERIRQAPFTFSTAGPAGAYRYWALSASVDVGDVYVTRLDPGVVGIYVVKKGGEIPQQQDPVLAAVREACSDQQRRPLTDLVQVAPAVAYPIDLSAQYWISEADQTRAAAVQEAVHQAVEEYKTWQTERIGRTVNPDELRKRMLNAGAVRIQLTSPQYAPLGPEQVAQIDATDIAYQGVE